MSELCHICDLFRTALFGPTNTAEDHLDDGQGDDLPEPMMADAPATMSQRSSRRGSQALSGGTKGRPGPQGDASANAEEHRALPVTTSAATTESNEPLSEPKTALGAGDAAAGTGTMASRPVPKTKFSKRAPRGLKGAPAYMSFDDVDVEDDDSDGELYVDETHGRGDHAGSIEGGAGASNYADAQVPSVYRAPDLPVPQPSDPEQISTTPAAPADEAPPAPEHTSVSGAVTGSESTGLPPLYGGHGEGDADPKGAGNIGEGKGSTLEQANGIQRDASTAEITGRPHAQSITESFHGYKGYPGYGPETPSAQTGAQAVPGNASSSSLTINATADVVDRRRPPQPEPTPSSPLKSAPRSAHNDTHTHGSGRRQEREQPPPSVSPTDTMDMHSARAEQNAMPSASSAGYSSRPPSGYRAASPTNSMASGYRRGESTRSIPPMHSEDGMGSVLGAIGGADETNEDQQWRRSALKKFHKVMVKGEGLRVVKHNRAGGSQMRIIRYDPEIKAIVWNSKRYMKKAGSANIPIVDIKRVGREGNTVSVTAAGRGTIGFEPQRIRDAKILEEALGALVDKERRSAMWRG